MQGSNYSNAFDEEDEADSEREEISDNRYTGNYNSDKALPESTASNNILNACFQLYIFKVMHVPSK